MNIFKSFAFYIHFLILMSWLISFSRFFNQNSSILWLVCTFIGSAIILSKVYQFLYFVYSITLRKRKDLIKRYGQDSWVLITGSSDGIGKQFAFSFAKQNFNIILTARTQSKLKVLKEQINKEYPKIKVKYVVIDFLKTIQKQDIQKNLLSQLQGLNISVVVNNVGMDCLSLYHQIPLKKIINLVQLNCFFLTGMNYLFLQRFLKSQKGDKKLIINVASVAGQNPVSHFNVYCGTKRYVRLLTNILALQYPGVDFMVLKPAEVSTPMTCMKKPDIMTILPHQCTQSLLNDIGYSGQSNGHWNHKVQSALYQIIPQKLFNFIWGKFLVHEFLQQRKNYVPK